MSPGESLAFMTLVISIGSVLVLRGPLGRALADRIAGRIHRDPAVNADVDQLAGQVDELRQRLAEMEERVDFAERLLARQKQHPPLPER
jgi:hypothetical protein